MYVGVFNTYRRQQLVSSVSLRWGEGEQGMYFICGITPLFVEGNVTDLYGDHYLLDRANQVFHMLAMTHLYGGHDLFLWGT